MRTSEQTDKIDAALAKAQAEMVNPAFDSANPHFKSKYASLAAVRNGIIPILARHGIACVQELLHLEGKVGCATRLSCAGQWIEFEPFFLPPSKGDAQGYGSASTYARRYSLQAIAGVAGDEDDDGNAVSRPEKRRATVNAVTPTAGAHDNVRPDRVSHIQEIANRVMDFYLQDNLRDAAMTFDESDLDNDEIVYFWTLFDSTPRSKIKAEGRRIYDEYKAAQQPTKEAA